MTKNYFITLFLILRICFSFGQDSINTYLFVGSYTLEEKSEGITVYSFNSVTGELSKIEGENNLINPSFLTISPNGKFLYSCTDTKLEKHGSVSAFKIDSLTGKLTFINKQTTGGRNPVHIVVDKNNKYIIVSNYTDAGISVFKCNPDGSIWPYTELIEFEGNSIISGRQDNSHIHSCNLSPNGKYIFAPDLGADKIRVFSFNNENLLTEIDSLTINTPKGSGPRHFTFHTSKPFAYCVEELSGTVSFYSYQNNKLVFKNRYKSYKNPDTEYASSDIHVSPDGKFLYVSNRQEENSISIFEISQINGELSLRGHQSTYGKIPRSFVIDSAGKYLIVANQVSNELVVFSRNLTTGLLTKTYVVTGLRTPSSLKMITF